MTTLSQHSWSGSYLSREWWPGRAADSSSMLSHATTVITSVSVSVYPWFTKLSPLVLVTLGGGDCRRLRWSSMRGGRRIQGLPPRPLREPLSTSAAATASSPFYVSLLQAPHFPSMLLLFPPTDKRSRFINRRSTRPRRTSAGYLHCCPPIVGRTDTQKKQQTGVIQHHLLGVPAPLCLSPRLGDTRRKDTHTQEACKQTHARSHALQAQSKKSPFSTRSFHAESVFH